MLESALQKHMQVMDPDLYRRLQKNTEDLRRQQALKKQEMYNLIAQYHQMSPWYMKAAQGDYGGPAPPSQQQIQILSLQDSECLPPRPDPLADFKMMQ